MRSHCAVYVDAGYLYAAAATRVTGTSLRSGIDVDHRKLIHSIIDQAEANSGLPLLRVNWYDSGARSGGNPDAVQEIIGLLPRVKLRLGRLSHSGDQKGVDLRIGLDLVMHARNGAVDVMYLVSGDDDLTEAVEEAQGHGIQVILLAVPNDKGNPHAVSRHLQREADGIITVTPQAIDAAVYRAAPRPAPETPPPAVSPSPAAAAPVPSPALLAQRKAVPAADPSVLAPRPTSDLVYSSATGAGILVGATGLETDEELEAMIDTVAESVLRSWLRNATVEQRGELLRSRPLIPGDIDRALLVDLSDRMGLYDLTEQTRFALRGAFWSQAERQLEAG